MTKHLTLLSHRIFPILLFIGLVWGQDYGSLTEKPKETSGNEEKFSSIAGILSFKKNPIILKKGDNQILINPGEKIKAITTDGNVVIGTYYKISILEKEIIVSGKKKNKIYYEEINKLSRGIGNKSVEYGIIGAILGSIGGFFLGNIIVNDDDYKGVMGAMFRIAGGISGLVVGISTGLTIPVNFEEPVLVNNNEWVIVN